MIALASKLSGFGYRRAVKPLLFKRHPDTVHEQLMKLGARTGRSRLLLALLRTCWAYENEPYLAQEIAGIRFTNPVGLSAGFDNNFLLLPVLKAIGFGHSESGSLTFHQCDGNAKPWFHRLPKTKSLVVNKGLANDGVEAIVKRVKSYPDSLFNDFRLNVSVAKTNSPEACDEADAIKDYTGSLELLEREGVGLMYTLNISCPNTYGGEPFTTPEKLGRLLDAVDELDLSKPVFIKMPSHLPWDGLKKLLEIAARHQVTGVTIHNLAKDRKKAHLLDPLPDTIKGHLSGKPTWETSNEFIRRTRLEFGNRFVIIGVGGIFSAEDAYTKIRLGANMVELITGMIFEGPQLIGQINSGLVELLRRDGFSNVGEAVGADLQKG